MMADGDDEDEPRDAARADAPIDLEIEEDIEEVHEVVNETLAIPPPRAPLAFRPQAPTPPPLPIRPVGVPPVVVVPPRNPALKTPPFGAPRPPLVPRTPVITPPVPVPVVAVPPVTPV